MPKKEYHPIWAQNLYQIVWESFQNTITKKEMKGNWSRKLLDALQFVILFPGQALSNLGNAKSLR